MHAQRFGATSKKSGSFSWYVPQCRRPLPPIGSCGTTTTFCKKASESKRSKKVAVFFYQKVWSGLRLPRATCGTYHYPFFNVALSDYTQKKTIAYAFNIKIFKFVSCKQYSKRYFDFKKIQKKGILCGMDVII